MSRIHLTVPARWLGAVGALVVIVGLGLVLWQPWATDDPASTTDADGDASDDEDPSNTLERSEPDNELAVTTTDDDGDGSLRSAILAANSLDGASVISFDNASGIFDDPQVIELGGPLPEITGDVVIDGYIPDRLWQATGVTLSAGARSRVLTVAREGKLTLRSLTVADGAAPEGAGLFNRGVLVLDSVTVMGNTADGAGGGVANDGGTVTIVNSTFVDNAADMGGGFANLDGRSSVVNSTFSENSAQRGGGIYNDGVLHVTNTIVANSDGSDCVSTTEPEQDSTNNLIESNEGCGTPISTDDPRLEPLGYYNGPMQTLPLRSGSPAVNLGDNATALDEYGEPLTWDQRGNGDPRFVAGYTDIGAFEHQAFPDLTVDTVDDVAMRSCSPVTVGDCPLRAAIELANATPEADVIGFDPQVFADRTTIRIDVPLPEVSSDVTLDASQAAPVVVVAVDGLDAASGVRIDLIDVTVE
jgi:hypothetical protein